MDMPLHARVLLTWSFTISLVGTTPRNTVDNQFEGKTQGATKHIR